MQLQGHLWCGEELRGADLKNSSNGRLLTGRRRGAFSWRGWLGLNRRWVSVRAQRSRKKRISNWVVGRMLMSGEDVMRNLEIKFESVPTKQ